MLYINNQLTMPYEFPILTCLSLLTPIVLVTMRQIHH
jgi:hypothetical protein